MSALLQALDATPVLIESVALAIADDEYPGLAKDHYRAVMDEFADPIKRAANGASADRQLAILVDHVYGVLGFRGNEKEYYDPRNSYLNEVLERRTGIPITLAVVLMAIGRRAGMTVEGVGFPGHFLVRFAGEVFIDPFSDGRRLARDEILDLASRFMGDNEVFNQRQLEPVDARSVGIRMLFNLQQIYERRGDHARALVVCDRLCEIADAPFHRRDRGMHALALGAAHAAVADLEIYLARHPGARDSTRIKAALERAKRSMTDHVVH